MSWYKTKSKKISLESLGYPDLFVEFRPMDSFTYRQASTMQDELRKTQDDLEKDPDSIEASVGVTKLLLARLITSWNLPPEDGDIGQVLPLPSEDPEVVMQLPLEVVNFIAGQLQGDEAVPN